MRVTVLLSACPPRTFSAGGSSTSCTPCAGGMYSDAGASTCTCKCVGLMKTLILLQLVALTAKCAHLCQRVRNALTDTGQSTVLARVRSLAVLAPDDAVVADCPCFGGNYYRCDQQKGTCECHKGFDPDADCDKCLVRCRVCDSLTSRAELVLARESRQRCR